MPDRPQRWGVGMYFARLKRTCQWPGCGIEFDTTAPNGRYCVRHQHDAELARHATRTRRLKARRAAGGAA